MGCKFLYLFIVCIPSTYPVVLLRLLLVWFSQIPMNNYSKELDKCQKFNISDFYYNPNRRQNVACGSSCPLDSILTDSFARSNWGPKASTQISHLLFHVLLNNLVFTIHLISPQIANGLDYLHSLFIIHRDIKPSNVLVWSLSPEDGVDVRLTDYGVSQFSSPSGLRSMKGTEEYMSPELCKFGEQSFYDEKVSRNFIL